MKHVFFLIAIVLVACSVLIAQQSIQISGQVTDKSTNSPLSNANIFVEEINSGTTTNQIGKYILNVQPGTYTISAGYMGYEVNKIKIAVSKNRQYIDFQLVPRILKTQEVIVEATRAKERQTPVVFTNIPSQSIRDNYSVQDIPMLLSEIPGVYSYSDAGNGLGYTYLKIRGFDQKRVAVMINGIPLNDPEEHQVYWVDMPDFAASVQDIQIQRGVGSSLYGRSSFGGSVNIITSQENTAQNFGIVSGYGSYNTKKFSFNVNSGLIDNKYLFSARFSKITSDGYRDHSAVDLWSYFISAIHYGLNTTTKINVYGGPELTQAAWEGSPQSELEKNHRHNPIDYRNAVDSFHQPHYELLHSWDISPHVTWHNTIFYIHGKGYYEALKNNRSLEDYGFSEFFGADSKLVSETDLVRQKWVQKDQIGFISRMDYEHANGMLSFGADFYTYRGNHWGKVIWAAKLPPEANADHTYYNYVGNKILGSFFMHELFQVTTDLSLMGDFNIQLQQYDFIQKEKGNFIGANRHGFDINYTFLNPKLGLNYNLTNTMNIFANVSMSHREPASDDLFDTWEGPDDLGVAPLFVQSDTIRKSDGSIDYIDWDRPQTEVEQLIDYEFGFAYITPTLRTKINAYWMDFRNEIVPFGQVDDDGSPIKGNAGKTVHRGIESTVYLQATHNLAFSGSLSLSQNYFSKFRQYHAVYDDAWNYISTQFVDFSGNTIAGFPDIMAFIRLAYNSGPLTTHIQIKHSGRQYLDNTEQSTRSINPFTLINWKAGYEFTNILAVKKLSFNIWVNNIFDIIYETAGYYDSYTNENYLWPGAERNIFFNIEIGL